MRNTRELQFESPDSALDVPQEVWDHYKNVVKQATTLFGATHYRVYHFLYTLSDQVAHFGLEHHESNDSRSDERSLVDPDLRMLTASLQRLTPRRITIGCHGNWFRTITSSLRPRGAATLTS